MAKITKATKQLNIIVLKADGTEEEHQAVTPIHKAKLPSGHIEKIHNLILEKQQKDKQK